MTATNHVLAGSLIALVVKRPELAIPLALVSHFVMDAIPHSAPTHLQPKLTKRIAVADSILAIILSCLIAFNSNRVASWIVIACALAAVLPDLTWAWRYYRIKNVDKLFDEPISKFSKWHLQIQTELHAGIITEAIFCGVMVTLIIHLR